MRCAVSSPTCPIRAALPAPTRRRYRRLRDPEQLLELVPAQARRGYDMRKVLEAIVDGDSLFHWSDRFGRSVICALARIDGHAVGVIASQPMQRAGVMDVPALTKEAAFADLCDTFNLPIVFFQDVPGLMIGTEAERGGILRGYERVVVRLARAEVPKIATIVRKAYGGGHIALGGRPVNPDLLLAWPGAELGFWHPRPACEPFTATGSTPSWRPRARRPMTPSSPSCKPSGRPSPSRGRPPACDPRRRDRPAAHA